MRIIIIIILFKLINITSFCQTNELVDYKVYSAIINSFNEEFVEDWRRKKAKFIVINQSSNFYNTFKKDGENYLDNIKYFCHACIEWNENKPSYDTVLINLILKLDTINNTKIQFENNFNIKKYKTEILSLDKFKTYFENDADLGWEKFYKDYPKSLGYMTLSNLAYSNDRSLCTIYIELRFGSLGAVGCILLINTNNYEIVKEEILWQS